MTFTSRPLLELLEAKKKVDALSPSLGDEIRSGRAFLGMSQSALAEASGVTQAYLSMVENGQRSLPTRSLEKIVAAIKSESEKREEDGEDSHAQEDI